MISLNYRLPMLTSHQVDLGKLCLTGHWTYYTDADTAGTAESLARGCYQRALLRGGEAWSGAGLKGNAKKYGMHYAKSRDALLSRLGSVGLDYVLVRDVRNGSRSHVAVIGRVSSYDDRAIVVALADSIVPAAYNLVPSGLGGFDVVTETCEIELRRVGPFTVALRSSIDVATDRPSIGVGITVADAFAGVGFARRAAS